MPWPELLSFALATIVFGGFAGLVAGMFGVGGGIITVPLLYTLFKAGGVSPDIAIHSAIGTSLLTIVPTSIASLCAHSKHGAVDKDILKQWMLPVILGAVLGSMIANHLSGASLSLIFGLFMLCISGFLGLTPTNLHASRRPPKGAAQKSLAFLIGLISALVGIGGGSLSVPTLSMYRVPIHRAIGTASAIGLLISLPGAVIFMLSQVAIGATFSATGGNAILIGSFGNVDLLAFALLAPATMLTAPIGAKLAHRLPAGRLRRIFAVFLAAIAVKMISAGLG